MWATEVLWMVACKIKRQDLQNRKSCTFPFPVFFFFLPFCDWWWNPHIKNGEAGRWIWNYFHEWLHQPWMDFLQASCYKRKLSHCLFKIIAAYLLLLLGNTFLTRTRNQFPILNETQIELGFPFLQARKIWLIHILFLCTLLQRKKESQWKMKSLTSGLRRNRMLCRDPQLSFNHLLGRNHRLISVLNTGHITSLIRHCICSCGSQ